MPLRAVAVKLYNRFKSHIHLVLHWVLTAFVLLTRHVRICECVSRCNKKSAQSTNYTHTHTHKCFNKRLRHGDTHTDSQRHAHSCTCSWVFWTRVISAKMYTHTHICVYILTAAATKLCQIGSHLSCASPPPFPRSLGMLSMLLSWQNMLSRWEKLISSLLQHRFFDPTQEIKYRKGIVSSSRLTCVLSKRRTEPNRTEIDHSSQLKLNFL